VVELGTADARRVQPLAEQPGHVAAAKVHDRPFVAALGPVPDPKTKKRKAA
jgi:hypothetical protein